MSSKIINRLLILSVAAMPGFASFAQSPGKTQKDTIIVTRSAGLTVGGIIKDAANGKPLSTVNVSVPGFSAALSDDNGKFTIRVPDYKTTLFLSGEGLQSKEIALRGMTSVTSFMYEDTYKSIYDNAYTPFGYAKPQNQTINAVVSVNTEGNWNRSNEAPDGLLQGKAAGLYATMRSGTPNAGAYLNIRGYNSLYATNQPLVIVDGVIFDYTDYGNSLFANHYTNALATIDPRDIDNITIIKDGVSTYGTKAANGVILITTNRATKLATQIDFGVYGGAVFAPKGQPVMQSADYRVYLSDILKTQGWSDARIQAQPFMNDDPSNPDYYRYHNNTNWQKEVLNNTAVNNYYLKVTGGDNIARYALSMGYMKDAGPTKNTNLTKYNVRFNADLNISKRLTMGANLAYTYYEQNVKDQGRAFKTNPIYLALVKAPFLHKNEVDNNGNISPNLADTDTLGVGNPVAAVNNTIDNNKTYRFFGAINMMLQLSRFMNIGIIAGITFDKTREQLFIPKKGIADDTLSNAIAANRLGSQAKRIFALYNDTHIDYDRTFARIHHLTARAGFRYQDSKSEQAYILGYNSATDDFISVGTGASALRKVGGGIGKNTWVNTYLSVDYTMANKYFFSFNLAADGSSKFGTEVPGALKMDGSSFAVMPSIGASWLVSAENFMAKNKLFDVLKLRATYAKTGNDDIGNYTGKQAYVSQNLLGVQGLVRGNISNPALQWEVNTKANFGIDVAVLNERLGFSFDIYSNKTDKMLTYETAPVASGYDYFISNGGAMKTTGMDFAINGRVINKKSLKWDISLNITSYKNRIIQMPSGAVVTAYGGATILTAAGAPAGIFYGYKTNGVYTTDAEAATAGLTKKMPDGSYAAYKAGDMRFVDVNGDKIIDDNDRQQIGNPNPDFAGGLNNKITWKNLSLEFLFTFSKGNSVYNGVRAILEASSNANNQLLSVVNRWRAPGQVTNMPKAAWGDPMGNNIFSDRWIEDGSFLRMKMVSLNYNLPLGTAKSVKYVTIYLTGNNLFTFTKYLGYDPEFYPAENILARGVDVGLEPLSRSLVAGIRIGL